MYRRPITEEVYLLSLAALEKIPEGTHVLNLSNERIAKPAQSDIEVFHYKEKAYTKYGWNHELAKEQGLEELFMLFLLSS